MMSFTGSATSRVVPEIDDRQEVSTVDPAVLDNPIDYDALPKHLEVGGLDFLWDPELCEYTALA